jgi:hypothetical protein
MKQLLLSAFLLATSINASALKVAIDATIEKAERPAVVGTTNLPDGIELMITLTRKESAFMAQDKARVVRGKFRAGPFSQKDAPLNPGVYVLSVSMPIASVQPPSTWPAIGNDGDKLEGPLTKKFSFGGRIAEFTTKIRVGDGKVSVVQDSAARAQSDRDMRIWRLKSCKDACLLAQAIAAKREEPFDSDLCYNRCVSK